MPIYKNTLEYWSQYKDGEVMPTFRRDAIKVIWEIIEFYETNLDNDKHEPSNNRKQVAYEMFHLYLELPDEGVLEAYAMQNLSWPTKLEEFIDMIWDGLFGRKKPSPKPLN